MPITTNSTNDTAPLDAVSINGPRRRPLHHGDLRRFGRSHHAQTAARALQPRPQQSAAPRIRHSRIRAKTRLLEEEFRKRVRDNIREYAGAPADCSLCDWLADTPITCPAISRIRPTSSDSKTRSPSSTHRHHTQGNVFYYLATLPQFFREIVRQLGEQGLTTRSRPLAPRHHRKAVRQRSGIGASAEPRNRPGAQGNARSTASTITSAKRPSRTF